MTLAHKLDHEPAGYIKLIPPLLGLPRVASILVGQLEGVQAAEDAVWSVIDGIDVDTADLWALERLAKIVGEARRPDGIEALRTLVKGRILANRSSGTIAFVKDMCDVLFDSVTAVYEGQLEVAIVVSDLGGADVVFALELIEATLAATVTCRLLAPGTFSFPGIGETAYTAFPDIDFIPTYAGLWPDRLTT